MIHGHGQSGRIDIQILVHKHIVKLAVPAPAPANPELIAILTEIQVPDNAVQLVPAHISLPDGASNLVDKVLFKMLHRGFGLGSGLFLIILQLAALKLVEKLLVIAVVLCRRGEIPLRMIFQIVRPDLHKYALLLFACFGCLLHGGCGLLQKTRVTGRLVGFDVSLKGLLILSGSPKAGFRLHQLFIFPGKAGAAIFHGALLVPDLALHTVQLFLGGGLLFHNLCPLRLQLLHDAGAQLLHPVLELLKLLFFLLLFSHIIQKALILLRGVGQIFMGQDLSRRSFRLFEAFDSPVQLLQLGGQLLLALLLTLLADVGKLRIIVRVQTTQLIILIQAAVRGDADTALPKLLRILTFLHISQKEIHVSLHVSLPGPDLLGQRARLHMLLFPGQALRIHHGYPPVFLRIQSLVDGHGVLHVFWLHDQGQLVPCQIALDGVAPFFIANLQQIGQNPHLYPFPQALIQLPLDFRPGIGQLLRVRGLAGTQLRKLALDELRLFFQAPGFRSRLTLLVVGLPMDLGQGFLQSRNLLRRNPAALEFFDII